MSSVKRLWVALLVAVVLLAGCSREQPVSVEVAKVEVPLQSVVTPDDEEFGPSAELEVPSDPSKAFFPAGEPETPRGTASKPLEAADSGSVVPGPGEAIAQAQPPNGEDGEDEEIPTRNYAELLKKPDELGFSPTQNLFRNVYYHIKQSFVEEITDEQLFEGVNEEVRELLTQAGVDTSALSTLNKGQKVLPQLLDLYGDKVDRNLLVFTAILGMLDGLDDNYSLLMTPKEYGKLQEQMQAKEFGGIGIYIELDKDNANRLTVFEPIEGTPAHQAGLEAGDRILKIDGEDTEGITLDMAQAAIRGPVGTKVVLTIRRADNPKPMDFAITRGLIHVVSVTSKMLPNKLGYVRLRMFGSQTAEELQDAVAKLKSQGARGLILDLRNNGGGYIDASVSVVGNFLKEKNGLVVYTIDRNKRRRDYRATENNRALGNLPMVVLINKFSASASEITAGALRDHKIATLVGEHSFGKGSVQQLYPFPDGCALKLTIARFYTPSGTVIDKEGIEPDIKLEMEPRFVGREGKDTQFDKAVEVLESRVPAGV